MMRLSLLLMFCLLPCMNAAAVPVPTEDDPVAASRAVDLAAKLRCLVCQNQTIAESNADLAVDLRREIAAQIDAGRSDAEILEFMVERYGDFVLYRPPFKPVTLLLWLGPLLLLILGARILRRALRAQAQLAAPPPLSAAERELAEKLLRPHNDTEAR